MGFLGDVWDAAKDVGKAIVGDEDDPGALGLSKKKVDLRPIDRNAFNDPNSEAYRGELQDRRAGIDARKAPTMQNTKVAPTTKAAVQTINRGEDQQVRAEQMALLNALKQQAAGQGPGQQLAEQAYDRANDTNLQNTMALAASRRGGSPGGGASLATVLDATAAGQQQNAAQMSADKIQAALEAQNLMAGVASGVRGQDIGVATSQADLASKTGMFNAGQENQMKSQQAQIDFATKQANLEAYLKNQGMNDEQIRYFLSQEMAKQEADRNAAIAYEDMATQQNLGGEGLDYKAFESTAGRRKEFRQDAGDTITDASDTSDKRRKINIDDLMADDDWSF